MKRLIGLRLYGQLPDLSCTLAELIDDVGFLKKKIIHIILPLCYISRVTVTYSYAYFTVTSVMKYDGWKMRILVAVVVN